MQDAKSVNGDFAGKNLVITHKSENARFADLRQTFAPKCAICKGMLYPNVGAKKMWVITKGKSLALKVIFLYTESNHSLIPSPSPAGGRE
jgi:hypothetical protein